MKNPPPITAIHDPLKEAGLRALNQVLEPLVILMLDAGVTVREATYILRNKAVLSSKERLERSDSPANNSRIAIMTGLPRSEVARALKGKSPSGKITQALHPVRKILAGWFDDAAFLDGLGSPLVLPIFGTRKSFDKLVRRYGGGIPTRAMLDELIRISAVELMPNQRVRPLHRIPVLTGLTPASLALIGERGRDLLRTLSANAFSARPPLFEATAAVDGLRGGAIAIGRRDVSQQGASFISGIDGLLQQLKKASKRADMPPSKQTRVGVTIFYFEDDSEVNSHSNTPKGKSPRKNFRRSKSTT